MSKDRTMKARLDKSVAEIAPPHCNVDVGPKFMYRKGLTKTNFACLSKGLDLRESTIPGVL